MPYAHLTATLEKLDEYGIVQEDLKLLRTDPDVAEKAALLLKGKPLPLEEHLFHGEAAKNIRTWNMFGFASYYNHFRLKLWEKFPAPVIGEELVQILNSSCHFSSSPVRDSYFLFLVPILKGGWRDRDIPFIIDYQDSVNGLANVLRTILSAKDDCMGFNWCLISWNPIPLTTSVTMEQHALDLPNEYKIPTMEEEALKMIFQKLNCGGKCSDPVRTQEGVWIVGKKGNSEAVSLGFSADSTLPTVGIGASRLFPAI